LRRDLPATERAFSRQSARDAEITGKKGHAPADRVPARPPWFINSELINCRRRQHNAPMPATREAFHRALDATLPFGPSYLGSTGLKLSSHVPMVLGALHRLGAPAEAFERHIALWLPRLVEERAADAGAGDPSVAPQLHQPYVEWLRHFEREAAGIETDALLITHLPALLAAPESAAFHGAIRLAYACDSGHRGEFIHALAAWCASFRSLGELPEEAPADAAAPAAPRANLHAALAAVRTDPAMAMKPRHGTTIFSDMQAAIDRPAFARHLARARPTLDDLAEASLAVYLATRDFTALHLVTGTHAVRVLLEHSKLDGALRDDALLRLWRAWLAAYVSIGSPAPAWSAVHEGNAEESDWNAALPALHASTNDHAIKLADSAREEWRHRLWPGYARCLPAPAPARAAPHA
jgi:hypothetical protein